MSTVYKLPASASDAVTVEDYLAAEEAREVRHEYVGGLVYAMAGTTPEHNIIAGNLFAALRSHLRGKPCEVFFAEVKLRLEHAQNDIFYYPDVMVTRGARDRSQPSKRFPKAIIEVLSDATARIDRREKFWAYMSIPTLEEYVLVAQDRAEATVFRRAGQWRAEPRTKLEETIALPSLDFTMALSAIYEGVKV